MFVNFIVLNTSWNVQKLAEDIESFDTVFIDLPVEFESYLREYEELQRVATFYSQELNALEKIVKSGVDVNVYCYVDNDHAKIKREISTQLLNLVLKAKLGTINVEEWKETIMDDLKSNEKFAEYEFFNIVERAGKKNACLNLNDDIERLFRRLYAGKKAALRFQKTD